MVTEGYLIQRATFQDTASPSNLDAAFQWDYMGSVEFEFGTLPRSIRALRLWDQNRKPLVLTEIKHDNLTAYFVGPEECIETATRVFKADLTGTYRPMKEYSGIKAAFLGKPDIYENTDTWVNVNDHLAKDASEPPDPIYMPWFLTKNKKAAETFLNLLRAVKV